MNRLARSIIEPVVIDVRRTSMRGPILKFLLKHDNWLRRWIAFFSIEHGLHPKHRLMNYHQFFIDNVTDTDVILDIGCGGGHVAYDVAQHAKQVIGIDIDQRYLGPSSQYQHQPNLKFIKGDATTYKFEQKFNAIILSNVLEHIEDRVGLLSNIKHLSPKFLIRVPMIDRDWLTLLKQEQGVEYRLDPTHFIEYTEAVFRQELALAGLTVDRLDVRFGEIYCVAEHA